MLPDIAGNHLPANQFQKPFYDWQETEEIQLRDYIDVILRRKWLILTVLALVFLSTLIFTLTVTRIYEASAVVEVSQENPHVTNFQEVLGSEIQAREFYETQVELIRSKAMIHRVIEQLDLIAHPVIRKVVFNDGQSGLIKRIRSAFKSLAGRLSPGQVQPSGRRGYCRASGGGQIPVGKPHGLPKPQVHVDRCGLSITGPPVVPIGGQHDR